MIAHDAIARPTRPRPGYAIDLATLNSVLILLPPSEGKTSAEKGPKLNVGSLSFPALNPVREDVLSALVRLSDGPMKKALTTLGLTKNQEHEVLRNQQLRTAATHAASEVYSGVLYEALEFATLSAAAKRKATAWVAVSSALFGLVRLDDRIPAYRLSGDAVIGTCNVAATWKQPVARAIEDAAGSGVVFDLRSGVYTKLGPLLPAIADNAVVGKVLLEKNGKRSVVSHFNKATKGRLVRDLALKGKSAKDPVALADLCAKAGYHVELSEPSRSGKPWTMEIVVKEL